MKRKFLGTLLILMLATGAACYAQSDVDGLKEIIATQNEKIAELTARIDALEATKSTPASARVTGDIKSADWPNRINMSGDFRFRYESINQDGSKKRTRNRIRLRTGFDAKLSDNAMVGMQLATGSGDPVSNNESLDNGFSNKGITITQAFLKWNNNDYTYFAGKMKNIFVVPGESELVWDGDLNPEGLALSWKSDSTFVNAGGFWVDERSSSADSGILGAQVGTTLSTGKQSKLLLAVSYYDFINAEGKATFFDSKNSFGNSTTAGNYTEDFNELNLSAEYSFIVAGQPAGLFLDYVKNTSTGSKDKGWLFGYKMGKCKAPGSTEYRLLYKRTDADAVVGLFTDSDFSGGGTDNKGFEFDMGYQASRLVKAGLSYFINESGLAAGADYNRLQLDMAVKF